MIRTTQVRILCFISVLLLLSITAFVLLSQKTDRDVMKQQRITLPSTSVKNKVILQGVEDVSGNAFELSPTRHPTPEGISDTSTLDIAEFRRELELIGAGKHPDYPPYPRREDFSSDLDYDKATLVLWKKELSETDDPEYQERFKDIIVSTEESIARKEAWIAGAEERRKEKLWEEEMTAKLIEMNAYLAGMNAFSEEERSFYLKYIKPNVQPDGKLVLPDEAFSFFDVSETTDTSADSVLPAPSVEQHESVSVPIPPDPNLPVRKKTLTEQIGSLDEALMKAYPDIFACLDIKSREAFSQQLPSEGSRQYFRHRQTLVHKEYAALLDAQLKSVPKKKREQAIETARQSLLQKWDSDFVDAVITELGKETE